MIIKNLRIENGWSQEKLAEITGLSLRTIQRVEKEDKASLESLNLLANAFSLDIKQLQDKLKNKTFETETENKNNHKKKITIFIAVNLLLIAINLLTNPTHLWFIYPLLGWGIPLFYKIYIKEKL